MALSNKQQAFVAAYLRHWNATQAAIEAGYSEKTASQIGYQLLQKTSVHEAVQARLSELAMGADEALVRLSGQARLDISPYLVIGSEGFEVDVAELIAAGLGRYIKGVEPTKFGTKVVFHDSFAALQIIARRHGLYQEAGEEDWRRELAKAGMDASRVFQELVGQLAAAFGTPDRPDDGRGGGPGAADRRGTTA